MTATDADEVGRAALDAVLETLRLERLDDDHFRGGSLPWRPRRVYGGQVLAPVSYTHLRAHETRR